MILKIISIILMVWFVLMYVATMVYANYIYGYNVSLFVFIGSICAFGFLLAAEIPNNSKNDNVDGDKYGTD